MRCMAPVSPMRHRGVSSRRSGGPRHAQNSPRPRSGDDPGARMTEAALSRQVAAELELFTYPVQDWVRPLRGPGAAPVHNVVIIGGGQAGLAIAFGLMRERISGVVVLDENPDGLEGPWITYARMITLRTLKFLTGPDLGMPSLTFRRWHAACHGDDAWARLVRIDKADWMRYLVWFRRTLNIPVRNR